MKFSDLSQIILKECSAGEFYGYEINKKLATKGINLQIGRLYIILNQMEKEKLISSRWEKSSKGPKKKYYKLTENGEIALKEEVLKAVQTIHEAYGTHIMSTPSRKSIFYKIIQAINDKTNQDGNIAYFTTRFSPIQGKIVSTIRDINPKATIYLLGPKEAKIECQIENTICLQGEYDNLPMKKNFLNVLFVINLPKKENLVESIEEWIRVLKENGRIGIIVPTIILHKPEEPISMGDFIEELEYQKHEKYDYQYLIEKLKNSFEKVDEKKILHLTVIICTKSNLTPNNSP